MSQAYTQQYQPSAQQPYAPLGAAGSGRQAYATLVSTPGYAIGALQRGAPRCNNAAHHAVTTTLLALRVARSRRPRTCDRVAMLYAVPRHGAVGRDHARIALRHVSQGMPCRASCHARGARHVPRCTPCAGAITLAKALRGTGTTRELVVMVRRC